MVNASSFTLPGLPQDGELTIALTRFELKIPAGAPAPKHRVSLVLAHGVSSHKEAWLPTIEYLEELQTTNPSNALCVVDAWSIDSPNHGHAAIMNEHKLLSRPEGITAYEWGRAVQVFLKSGLIQGTTIVGIGHSAGACVITLSTAGYPTNRLPFSAIVLVDPPMMTREILTAALARNTPLLNVIETTKSRRDIWPSRAAAKEWMSKRLPWKRWTPRALELYVEHALRDLPTATYPNATDGVTLACTRTQEAAGYIYHEDGVDSLEMLKDICIAIPVHCILGEQADLIHEDTRNAIIDPAQGRKMASVTKIAGSGHLVVQEDPKGLAVAIWRALHREWPQHTRISRL